jgi:Family of unknown function (DUF5681)
VQELFDFFMDRGTAIQDTINISSKDFIMTFDPSLRPENGRKNGEGLTASEPVTPTEEYKAGPGHPPKEYQLVNMTSDASSDRKNGCQNSDSDKASDNSEEYKVGRDRLPNGKWPPGVSGNPKGRKPKNPSNHLDHRTEFDQALDEKVKVTHGEKKRMITKRTAVLEQWVNLTESEGRSRFYLRIM